MKCLKQATSRMRRLITKWNEPADARFAQFRLLDNSFVMASQQGTFRFRSSMQSSRPLEYERARRCHATTDHLSFGSPWC